jgi:hypothetical protein
MKRYQVIEESESAHCCFEATVVDTHKPHEMLKGKFHWVCECFDLADAKLICDALNKYHA